MNFNNLLEDLKIKISHSCLPINKDFEFDANLEDHFPNNKNIYRLYYIKFYRRGNNSKNLTSGIGVINVPFDSFIFPSGFTREDGFKVLSYLIDYIEEKYNLESCSLKSVTILNNLLDLEELGFKKLDTNIEDDNIANLFTVTGRIFLFKLSKYYPRYFEWYQENITLEEVKKYIVNVV